MKIALLNALYAPYQMGGAERSVQIVAEGLCRQGHSVCVVTLGESHLAPRSVINGVTVHRLPLENWYWPFGAPLTNAAQRAAWHLRDLYNRAMSARVGRVLDSERPDVLHTNGLAGFSVGVWSQAKRRGIRIVHSLRDYYLMCPPSAMYRKGRNCERICARCLPFAAYRRRATQSVHAVSGVSDFILERHMREGYFNDGQAAKVIFNPMPAQVQRESVARPARGLVYGYIGRVSPHKGVRWLLEAFVQHASPDDQLVLAGTGDRRFVESMTAQFASPAVKFIGHADSRAFYEQVDVVVVPSLWHEPFGRTAIEPMGYGVPVIASNRGGLAEIVDDGVTGIVVDPDDTASLGRAMRRLSADPELVARLGANCGRQLSRFSAESITDAYASLYAEVMQAPHTSRAGGTRDTRLLYLSHRDVIPPNDGGKESIHGAIAALARRADVTYAYPAGVEPAATSAGYSAINVRAVPVRFSPEESAPLVAASTLRLLPYKFAKHSTRRAVDSFAAALESRRFDAVVCSHPHVVRLAEGILKRRGERLPIFLREHNIEYALVESYAQRLGLPLRLAARAYAWITRREEQSIWRRVAAVALMSDADLMAAQATGVEANFLLAPEGVPLPPVREALWPGRTAPLLVLFNPRAPQSVINLRLFYEHYWLPVQAADLLPETRLAITGVGSAELARLLRATEAQLGARNVHALGFVDSLPEVFASSLALVSATFAGAGVRKKVLEAMAHQVPVMATSMDVTTCSFYRQNENILRFDTVAELVAAAKRLADDPAFWLSLSREGRSTVETHATWERFADAMMTEVLRQVGAGRAQPLAYQRFQAATER